MNILIISAGKFLSSYGGGQVYVRRLVDEFMKRDELQISILDFSHQDERDSIEETFYRGGSIYSVSSNVDDAFLSSLLKIIRPDIVHIHGHKSQMSRVCRTMNIPCVVTAHHGGIVCPAGALLNSKDKICYVQINYRDCLKCCLHNIRFGNFLYPVLRLIPESTYISLGELLKKLPFIYYITPVGTAALSIKCKKKEWKTICANCSKMIAPSHAIQQAMEQNGMPSEKLIVIPHGVPQPNIPPSFPAIKNQRIKFFYVGRISYIKGIHILLEAFHRVTAPHAELHLIGGAGTQREKSYMEHLKKKYDSDSRILWHGKLNEAQINAAISQYHILIHPTISMEVFGLNIAEALTMGKWVLSTQCGGAEMQIIEGKNGWLVSPNNIAALKNIIEGILLFPPCSSPSVFYEQSIEKHVTDLLDTFKKLI